MCKLRRSLYGLKQSPRCFNEALDSQLKKLGFKNTTADACIYSGVVDSSKVLLAVYVDDILLASCSSHALKTTKQRIGTQFKTKDLGPASFFLGVSVRQDQSGISMSQPAYIQTLLDKFGLGDCNTQRIPMTPDADLHKRAEGELAADESEFRSMIGSLMYLSTATRPDLSFAVHRLAQFSSDPSSAPLAAVKRIFRYLRATKDFGIRFRAKDKSQLTGYVDADWAACLDTSRSTTGCLFLLAGGPVAWMSRRQRLVTKSTAESEFIALSEATAEVTWLRTLLAELGYPPTGPTAIWEDNAAAVSLANNPVGHQRTKHITVKLRFVQDGVENGEIQVAHVSTQNQMADALTKPVPYPAMVNFRKGVGVEEIGI